MEKKRLMVLAAAAAAGIIVVFLPGFSELQKLREKNDQLAKRIELLEEHNEQLKNDLRKMKADPEHVERKAREKLGIVKKGEILYKSSR